MVAVGGISITMCNPKAIQMRIITGWRLMLTISFYAGACLFLKMNCLAVAQHPVSARKTEQN